MSICYILSTFRLNLHKVSGIDASYLYSDPYIYSPIELLITSSSRILCQTDIRALVIYASILNSQDKVILDGNSRIISGQIIAVLCPKDYWRRRTPGIALKGYVSVFFKSTRCGKNCHFGRRLYLEEHLLSPASS